MASLAFDTLRFSKRLKRAGVPTAQAEAEAEALSEILIVNLKELASKKDLLITQSDLQHGIKEVKSDTKEIKGELKEVQSDIKEIKGELKEVQNDIKEIKGELKEVQNDIKEIKGELKEVQNDIKEIKGELKEVQDGLQEVRLEVTDLRKDMNIRFSAVDAQFINLEQRMDAKIDRLDVRLSGEMILIKWMFGILLTGTLGILTKLFF